MNFLEFCEVNDCELDIVFDDIYDQYVITVSFNDGRRVRVNINSDDWPEVSEESIISIIHDELMDK